MVLHNPNNWHWVNKDAAPWARQYLEDNIRVLHVEENGVSAKLDKLTSMDGDVDVSQRKGKVITIFDVKLTIEYSGKTKDDEEVSGTITVPEVAHDTEEHEYVFDIDISSNSASKAPVRDLVKSKIIPLLRKEFVKLGPALIAEHGKDIQHSTGSSLSNPSAPILKQHEANPASSMTSSRTETTSTVNTTTVTDNEEFRAPATELYRTFIDPQRIAAFTRAPPKIFEGANVGCKFELFGGNVAGEYTELLEPTKIVQKWRLDTWPKGHFSRLEIVFDQNDIDNVTVMRVTWSGVPIGHEEVTKKNWKEYYVRSIKQTFGFGAIL
ncbi:BgTH12-06983 [Blumeria graminis f. sp. triticale]|uniref:Bgt-3805 n=3 Tax=Blumeria graminis TaxID=34373 RepID=A0A061HRE4_BLUGR|nr:Co-chaperone of Hsp82p [Blumeria graminis f. sp. tritici 96224]CAD6506051.1 BgTH12-06983 [Blumeria graminis f. sp. triticale]VDB94699.1 Bgt-3805 [Blumeria graminis f. sp. tritici]